MERRCEASVRPEKLKGGSTGVGAIRTRPGWTGLLRWAVALAAGALIGVLAGQYVVTRPSGPSSDDAPVRQTYMISEGTLNRTLRFPAMAEWAVTGIVYAPAGGVVTEIVKPSGAFGAGDLVLRLNERPVVVLPAPVPAFRDLAVGSQGRDVAALQAYLATLGYPVAADLEAFTKTTLSAVRTWQRALRLPPTGVVARGDLLFVDLSDLDGSPLRWTAAVTAGASLSPGAPILERLADAPTLTIEFGETPPDQFTEGLRGRATFPAGQQVDVILSAFRSANGRLTAELVASAGPLCDASDCLALVPADGKTQVDVEFTLVPETTGPLVPAAAVQSDATGQAFVELPDGRRQPVTVIVASEGMVIVDGVASGQEVVLP